MELIKKGEPPLKPLGLENMQPDLSKLEQLPGSFTSQIVQKLQTQNGY